MEEYYELEKCVLSCLLAKPELMEQNELKDEYFIKYKRLWIFMKSFYERFKTFDKVVMKDICTNKNMMVNYLVSIEDNEGKYVRFNLYKQRLIDSFNENKKDKAIIEVIYKLANDLYVRNINLKQFKEDLTKILKEN